MSSNRTKTYHSFSSKETKTLGARLAREVLREGAKPARAKSHGGKHAVVLALRGDLGAGKTTFVQGFFKGLGLKSRVPSPTFVIMRRNALKNAHFSNVFHLDVYRLKSAKPLAVLGVKEILADPKNIVLIEWAEKVARILPKGAIKINFSHPPAHPPVHPLARPLEKREHERTIVITRP